MVSHDRWFLDRVATRILYLDGDGGWRTTAGDLSSFLERLREERDAADTRATRSRPSRARSRRSQQAPEASEKSDSGQATTGASGPRRLTNWESDELAQLPEQIEAAEAELATLDERLADPGLYTGPVADRERLTVQRSEVAARAAELYRRWEELEERSS